MQCYCHSQLLVVNLRSGMESGSEAKESGTKIRCHVIKTQLPDQIKQFAIIGANINIQFKTEKYYK